MKAVEKDSMVWIVAQNILSKGLLALKFFIAARVLGPEAMGVVGVVFLVLVLIESLTVTGLQQSMVYSHDDLNSRQLGAAWLLQQIRGVLIACFLLFFSDPLSNFFEIKEYLYLFFLTSAVPILKNSINPGVYILSRRKDFRSVFVYESIGILFDLLITICALFLGLGEVAILLGSIVSECIKSGISWTAFRVKLCVNMGFDKIRSLISYGKWIWASNVLITFLNQADKIIVSRVFGAYDFGLYQVGYKSTNVLIAEPCSIVSQYLFPHISKKIREGGDGVKDEILLVLTLSGITISLLCLILFINANFLILFFLGGKWVGVEELFKLMLFPSGIGGMITILVSYVQATGRPRLVTEATLLQLISLVITAPIMYHYYGLNGIVVSTGLAGLVTLLYLTKRGLQNGTA